MDDARGDCAILAVRRFRPVLANPKEHSIARAEALKFIVHIIGDLHQPLHCVTDKRDFNNLNDLGDIGGNQKIVQFNVPAWDNDRHKDVNPRWSEQWNLHSVWDEAFYRRDDEPSKAERAEIFQAINIVEELYHKTSLISRNENEYDDQGRLVSQVIYNPDGCVSSRIRNSIGPHGKAIERIRHDGDLLTYRIRYAYDSKGRLAEVETVGSFAEMELGSEDHVTGKIVYVYKGKDRPKEKIIYNPDGAFRDLCPLCTQITQRLHRETNYFFALHDAESGEASYM